MEGQHASGLTVDRDQAFNPALSAVSEASTKTKRGRFMGRSVFQILDTSWDHEPGSDCPVAARQDPGLELDPVRWPSSRCDEGSGVLPFMEGTFCRAFNVLTP